MKERIARDEAMIAAYQTGKSVVVIGGEFGVHSTTVGDVLKANGVEIRKCSGGRPRKPVA